MNVSHSHKATSKPITKTSDSNFDVFIEEMIHKSELGTNQRKPKGKGKLHHASEIKDEEYEEYDGDEYEEIHKVCATSLLSTYTKRSTCRDNCHIFSQWFLK